MPAGLVGRATTAVVVVVEGRADVDAEGGADDEESPPLEQPARAAAVIAHSVTITLD